MPARGKELVKTDLSIAIPAGTYARIAPRSGLAWKNFIDTGAGVRVSFGLSFAIHRQGTLKAGDAAVSGRPTRARWL